MDYSGKIIRKNPVTPSQTSASGVWTLDEALQAQRSNTWPVANVPDPISRSLRFRSSASANLNRTPATTSSQTTCTWSGWIKRTPNYTTTCLSATNGNGSSNNDETWFIIGSDNVASIVNYVAGAFQANVSTPAVFRDPSAWYHVVFVWNTTSATSTDRCIIYVNGVRQTLTFTTTPSQNNTSWFNTGNLHRIGAPSRNAQAFGNNYYDGYMTEVNFIDGQALTPSSFGGTNAVTGVWEPRQYTGTYGTNGFLLTFSDITSTATLGNDTSGNSNSWTTNNFSLTAGATYDSMLDVPTQWIGFGTDAAAVTRGNYATFNPILYMGTGSTKSNGNLRFVGGGTGGPPFNYSIYSTFTQNTGKWYWETTIATVGGQAFVGMFNTAINFTGTSLQSSAGPVLYGNDGNYYNETSPVSFGATYTTGDVIGVAVDFDNSLIWFSKNGTFQASGNPAAGTNGRSFGSGKTWGTGYVESGSSVSASAYNINFGQQPFAYTPPAGFVSLCTTNLPSPTILQGNRFMDSTAYTGTGSSNTIANAGGFQPDLVWIKRRNATESHGWWDSVRGGSLRLESNTSGAESNTTDRFSGITSTGFTVTSADPQTNASGSTYVGWQWRANGTPAVTNTAGSITSTVSANTTSGFSIVTYTGTGANATVGHGLGVAPSVIICKRRTTAGGDWQSYHISLGATRFFKLNTTDAAGTASTPWNDTAPTSSVFTIGTNGDTNLSGASLVAYCFAAVPGYSAFGSYTGNGSSDGPFVYTGFRPEFVLFRRTDTTGGAAVADTTRDPFNVAGQMLYPYGTDAEGTNPYCDFVSNGFKVRGTSLFMNANGGTYIYMAFAETPFKNALARQGINNRRNIMFAVVQNGQLVQVVQPDQPFTVGDKQYSARFIRNSTPQEKLDAGVWEVIDQGRPDDRYYWVTGPTYRLNEVNSTVEAVYTDNPKALEDRLEVKEDGTPLYVQVYNPATEQMEDTTEQVVTKGLKSQNIAQVKQTAGSLLAQTDWYVVRKADIGTDVPADVVAYRAAIRAEADRLEAAIAAVTDVAGLIAVQADWPTL